MMNYKTFEKILKIMPEDVVATFSASSRTKGSGHEEFKILSGYQFENTEAENSYKMKKSELLKIIKDIEKRRNSGEILPFFEKAEWRVDPEEGGSALITVMPHHIYIRYNGRSDKMPEAISDLFNKIAPRSNLDAKINVL